MPRAQTKRTFWAIKTDETSRLDGRKIRLHLFWWKSPKLVHGTPLMLFRTRRQARDWLKEDRGYIARRPDLRREPHCWRVGKVVRVVVTVREA